MTHLYPVLRFAALLTCLGLPLNARTGIIPSPAASNTEYHVELGLTYASGIENVINQMEKTIGFERESTWPIGLRISAYAKMESGIGFGMGVGPWTTINVEDRRYYPYHNNDVKVSYIVPVFADIRYYFPRAGFLTPYIRAGVAYPISGGDYIGAGDPGPLVALGAHAWEHRYVTIGIEAGYDGSKVEVKSGYLHAAEKLRPTEFTLSVFASF